MNPAIYLISVLPGVGVWLMAGPTGTVLLSLLAATVAVALLQHAINVLNDLADWRLGADVEKWDSWVRFHGEDIHAVARHGAFSFWAGGLLGLTTLASNHLLWILFVAAPMVGLGYLYNSGVRPLSYTQLGEWVTGLCYGPGVFGCLWLVSRQQADLSGVLGCLAFGCLAVAILLSHQPPQIRTDRQAGKQSFAVRYGPETTYRCARLLFAAFLLTWALALANRSADGLTLGIDLFLSGTALAGSMAAVPTPKYLLLAAGTLFLGLALVRPE